MQCTYNVLKNCTAILITIIDKLQSLKKNYFVTVLTEHFVLKICTWLHHSSPPSVIGLQHQLLCIHILIVLIS